MNIALLVVVSTVGQCPTPYGPVYAQPIYVHAPSSVIREKVYFSGEIRSRRIVEAVLSNGRKITVPVINGYMPSVRVTVASDGSELREYDYDDRDVYDGGVITYKKPAETRRREPGTTAPRPATTEERTTQRTPVLPSPVAEEERTPQRTPQRTPVLPSPVAEEERIPQRQRQYTDEDFEALQKDFRELQKAIQTLQNREESAERPPMTLQADPQRIEPQPPKLKKPSEFGQTK